MIIIIFSILMGVAFLAFFVLETSFVDKRMRKPIKMNLALPRIVTTLGVLGTFVGITQALRGFNPSDIDGSLPLLLDGMKTAFITSIAGMGLAMLMNLCKSWDADRFRLEESTDTGEEIVLLMIKALKEVSNTLIKNDNQMETRFKYITNIMSNNQQSLITVIRELNTNMCTSQETLIKEVGDMEFNLCAKQDTLIESFNSFAATMTEQNTDSLIQALSTIIKDFNTELTEQFGENFKELNTAVGKLLVWQENYKDHIELTTQQLKTTTESFVNTEVAISSISEKAGELVTFSSDMNNTLAFLDKNQKVVYDNTTLIAQIGEKARDLIPNMENYVDMTNSKVTSLVENLNTSLTSSSARIEEHLQKITEKSSESMDINALNLKDYLQQVIDKSIGHMEDHSRTTMNTYTDNIYASVVALEAHLEVVSTKSTKNINDNTTRLEEHLQEVITEVITGIESTSTLVTNNLHEQSEEYYTNFNKMIFELKESIPSINSIIRESKKNFEDTLMKFTKETQQLIDTSVQNTNTQSKTLERLTNTLDKTITSTTNNLGQHIETVTADMAKQVHSLVRESEEVFKTKVEQLDKVLEKELNTVLTSLGTQLVQISNKFAEDYTPLANKLKEVVDIAKGVNY
ncbi:MotA/TolQ/ExbB proton channel family protein [Lutibacter sp. B2]|nr:MotA/TolQ/ExbB proton channel family protein [Lutibacter sp. B2]